MKKRVITVLLSTALAASMLAGCGNSKPAAETGSKEATASGELETVKLTVWAGETPESQEFLAKAVESFKEAYADKANFDISLGTQSESTAKDTILADVTAAADVFYFADDQIRELVSAGALQEIVYNPDEVKAANTESSIEAASVDGKLYAYPATASNGYFMYYNKEYFTEDDVQSLDRMMEVAAASGKQITMTLNQGWYLYSFFAGAGLELTLNEDGVTNSCNWNATDTKYKGTDVVDALLAISSNPGFVSLLDAEFQTGIAEGNIIAGVNGTWNANLAQETWGENYAAAKLPTYTVAGDQVQMGSYAGYKLVGVSAYSEQPGYAMLLADWLTNYENQMLRFELVGETPSNKEAASSDEVLASPAVAALAAQSEFADPQRVGVNYWAPSESFGQIIVNKNQEGTDAQTLLDNMVEGIVAPVQ